MREHRCAVIHATADGVRGCPRNFLGAVTKSHPFEGGDGEGWFATSLTRTLREGIGAWQANDLVDYIKTGANAHARAMSPMPKSCSTRRCICLTTIFVQWPCI